MEHTGSLKSGHYTATIKCPTDKGDKWIKFNDSTVIEVSALFFNCSDLEKNPQNIQNPGHNIKAYL